MSSDTNTSSSSCEEERKRHKTVKKHKRKSDKKKKKKKCKDFSRKHKAHEKKHIECTNTETLNIYGPILPPHLLNRSDEADTKESVDKPKIIGPVMPMEFSMEEADQLEHSKEANKNPSQNDSDLSDVYDGYGPAPMNTAMTSAQLELEQRALEMKLAAIEGRNIAPVDVKTREEWMLELPEVGLRGGLAALSNMKRTFHQGKERPDFSDRTMWTKTPQDAEKDAQNKAGTSKQTAEAQKREAQAAFTRKRDEEQEHIANSHKKKHKREESLVEIHQKKVRKEQKKMQKNDKPERRPFTRDVDLKLNKIDSHQTKQIVDKAKILHSKFSSGQAKYL